MAEGAGFPVSGSNGAGPGSTAGGTDTPEQAAARQQMVDSQLARRGIQDPRILAAMARVPRHRFVPEPQQAQAYADHPLSIGGGQTISQPYIVARMTELLRLAGPERVLEVGTGSGYQTAVLAELAREVYTIEALSALADRAERTLRALGYTGVHVRAGDGTLGWPEAAPFNRIIVTAAGPSVPPPLVDQLAEGGRLVMPVGSAAAQVLHILDKREGRGQVTTDCDCVFVKLVGRHGWPEPEAGPTEI
jgi:protein-L-isoaspartate(D-aspartate) O-methyltransferase